MSDSTENDNNTLNTFVTTYHNNTCPLCDQGFSLAVFDCKQMRNNIMKHLEEQILDVFHSNIMVDCFQSVCYSKTPLLQKWVHIYGILDCKIKLDNLSINNLNCLLENGYNIQLLDDKFSSNSRIDETVLLDILCKYQYRPPSYQSPKDDDDDCLIDVVKGIDTFKKCIEIYQFTEDDAKFFILQYIKQSIIHDYHWVGHPEIDRDLMIISQRRFQQIMELVKLFNLQNFIKTISPIKEVLLLISQTD